MDDGIAEGLVDYVLLAGALLLGGWLLPHVGELARAGVRLARRLQLLPAELPAPAERDIAHLAADLRRLRAEALAPRPRVTMARQRGIVAAYDDALVLACQALDIETTLASLPTGLEHESERLRVEFELQQSGIDLA